MRNFVECKRKSKAEAVNSENDDDMKSVRSSSVECKRKDQTERIY